MTPEQFQQYLLTLPESERLQVIDNMWAHVDNQLPGFEQLGPLLAAVNPNVMMDLNPVSGPEVFNQAVNTVFSPLPNALNQVNRIGSPEGDYGYDTSLTYRDVMQNAGYGDTASGLLGFLAELVEPGPGEFAHLAAGVGGAATMLGRLLKSYPADEALGRTLLHSGLLPSNETLWRVQDATTGRGPYVDMPSTAGPKVYATENITDQPARYFESTEGVDPQPTYISGAISDINSGMTHVNPENLEVVMGAPVLGTNVFDVTQPNIEMAAAMLDQLKNGVPFPGRDLAIRDLENFLATGALSEQSDAWRTMSLGGGFDRAGIPHAVGMDRSLQFPDDNYAASRLLGWGRRPSESVVFNPNAVQIQQAFDLDEFMEMAMDLGLPQAARAFPVDRLTADALAGGFTFNPRTGARPSTGFAFSELPGRELRIPANDFDEFALSQYIANNADVLEDPNHFLGAWLDRNTDEVVVDISTVIDDVHEALRRAFAAQQTDIFDLGKFESISTGFRRP